MIYLLLLLPLTYGITCLALLLRMAYLVAKEDGATDKTFLYVRNKISNDPYNVFNIVKILSHYKVLLKVVKENADEINHAVDDLDAHIEYIKTDLLAEIIDRVTVVGSNPYIEIISAFMAAGVPEVRKVTLGDETRHVQVRLTVNEIIIKRCMGDVAPIKEISHLDVNYMFTLQTLLLECCAPTRQNVFNNCQLVRNYMDGLKNIALIQQNTDRANLSKIEDQTMTKEYTLLEILENHAVDALEVTFIDEHGHSATIRQYGAITDIDMVIISATIKRLSELVKIIVLYGTNSDAKRAVFELTEQGPWIVTKGRAEE